MVIVRYPAIEHEDLIRKLAKFAGGPNAIIGRARGLRDLHGGTVSRNLAEAIVELYNRGRRKSQLEPWRS